MNVPHGGAQKKTRRSRGRFDEGWCKTEFGVTFGEATEETLQQARETKAELVVMGAKARKSFAGHAPLTVAYNVVAKANCPVLTVRG